MSVAGNAVGRMILITGGCRSGKSAFAIQKAGELTERVCYVATCVPGDEEMKARVAEHRARRPDSWRTIEEPLHLTRVIGELDGGRWPVVVVDCLTLWLFNLMSEEDWGREAESKTSETERRAAEEAERLADACRRFEGTVFLVTNEVGMGIVPGEEVSRAFRDALGRCNQILAASADEVYLIVAGQPLQLKGKSSGLPPD